MSVRFFPLDLEKASKASNARFGTKPGGSLTEPGAEVQMPTGARKWKASWKLGSSPSLSVPPSLSLNQLQLPTYTHWTTWPATESKCTDT